MPLLFPSYYDLKQENLPTNCGNQENCIVEENLRLIKSYLLHTHTVTLLVRFQCVELSFSEGKVGKGNRNGVEGGGGLTEA